MILSVGFGDGDGLCSLAVIDWTPELSALVMQRRLLLQNVLEQDRSVAELSFWDSHVTWYDEDDFVEAVNADDMQEYLRDQAQHFEDECWCVLPERPSVEAARTDDDVMRITTNGVLFTCTPKYAEASWDRRETVLIGYDQVIEWTKEQHHGSK